MEKKWPDGATHFDPATRLFYRRRGELDWEFFVNCAQGWCDSSDWHGRKNPPDRVIARPSAWGEYTVGKTAENPVEWTGQDGSLPPVGLAVEAYFPTDSKPTWLPTVLLYASDENVIYSEDEEGEEIRRSRADFNALQVKFRPIRTAEQLAGEEREKDAESLFQVIHPDGKWHKADGLYKERFRAAIDAGYRK